MNLEEWIKAKYTPIYDNGSWQDFIAVYDVRELFAGKQLVDKDAVVVSADDLFAGIAGCTDGFCCITGQAKGMHTNGGCRCASDHLKMQRVMGRLRKALSASEVKP